ncbi:MAG: lysophospholipid acyltransferase family protein [Candidatus Rariloculaceae bacterium]
MGAAATIGRLRHVTYGIYAWIALLLAFIPALLLLVVTPGRPTRRRVTRWFSRLFFFLIGSPVRSMGSELPDGACVVVANHASYLDGIILTAALPARFTFVIKEEMARFPFAGYLLRRIGSEFVNRQNSGQRQQATRRLFKAAREGDALAFFPEGTFDDKPGLRRFQPGAFGAAWRAKIPVVPVVIYGARAKLPAHEWLPAPGPLGISIGEPIHPDAFDSARSVMLASRASLLAILDEPDLAARDISADSQQPADDL